MPINFYISELPSGGRQAFLTDLEKRYEVEDMLKDSGSDEEVIAFRSVDSEKHPNALSALAQLALLNSEYNDSIGGALEDIIFSAFEIGGIFEIGVILAT